MGKQSNLNRKTQKQHAVIKPASEKSKGKRKGNHNGSWKGNRNGSWKGAAQLQQMYEWLASQKWQGNGGGGGGKPQYENVPGTKIKFVGGEYVRIAKASGKTFHPNDVQGVYAHLEKHGGGLPAAGAAGGGGGKLKDQYERVEGTKIKIRDGVAVRVVPASGKEFPPNDLQGVYGHLEKLYSGAAPQKGGGGRTGKGRTGKGGGKGKRGNAAAMFALPAPGVKKQSWDQKASKGRGKGRFAQGLKKLAMKRGRRGPPKN